jgi:vitamin B12 transporter
MVRFLASVLITGALFAQAPRTSTLEIKVIDPSGAPVASAVVRATSRDNTLQQSARTDEQGVYRFQGLPPGEYWLEALTSGLEQGEPSLVRLETGQTFQAEVKLTLSKVTSRINVTSSSTAESTEEAGKAMDVLDSTDIARRAEFSLTETLRVVPGMRVQQLGGPGTFTRVLVRGMRATDSGVLVDGMRFRDAGSVQGDATAFLGDLLMGMTDRVEVLRGSGSSLYGTHATGGVMNLVTDHGGGPVHGDLSAEGGGLGLFRVLGRMSGGAWKDRLQYAGGLQTLNISNGVDGIERVRNWSGQGYAQYRVLPNATLSGRFLGSTSMVGINVNPSPAPNLPAGELVPAIPLASSQVLLAEQGLPFVWGNATFAPNLFDPDSRRDANFTSTLAAWSHQVTSRAAYRISYQAVTSDRDNLNGPGGPGYQPTWNTSANFGGRIDTLQARTDLNLASWNVFSAGYEYERESYNSSSSDANPDLALKVNARTSAVQKSNSVFFQDQLRLFSQRLQIAASGRYQGFQLDAPQFAGGAPQYEGATLGAPPNAYTGDVAVSYFLPRSSTKLRAHAGNAYRAPALYERFGAYFYGGFFGALGDPRLRPERSLGVDAGVDQYFLNNRLRVGATYFYSRLQEVIGYGNTPSDPFGRYSGYLNTGGGLARGVEVSGEARPTRSTILQASYTYVNADERNSPLIGGTLAAIRVFPRMVTAVATQQVGRRLQLSADYWWANQYIGGTFFVVDGIRPYLFGGPNKLDVAATYTIPIAEKTSLRLFTRIENVLNQSYYEEGFRTPKAWAVVGMKFLF